MAKSTLKCYGCKQTFRREELVAYASPGAEIMHNYCPACLKEKQSRENFSRKVCEIFGLKAPGPRIWKERVRLQDTYGYTDDVIIDCLDYIYNVEKKQKLAESLCLVKPVIVEKMRQYKKSIEQSNQTLMRAMKDMKIQERVVPIQENTFRQKEVWDDEEWLDKLKERYD